MKYYVYVLADNGVPFYVGKGTKDRMHCHAKLAMESSKRHPLLSKIRKMLKEGREIEYQVVFTHDDPEVCLRREIELISEIGRRDLGTGTLCNLTEGGEGVKGYNFTEQHRQRLSNALKAAYAAGRSGLKAAHDTHQTPEYKRALCLAMRNFWDSEDGQKMRQHIGSFHKGKRTLSAEARQKMSEGAKRANAQRARKRSTS